MSSRESQVYLCFRQRELSLTQWFLSLFILPPLSFVPSSVSFYTRESLPLMECGGFKVERLISNLPPRPL